MLLWKYETGFEVWTHLSSYDITGDGIPDIFAGSDDKYVYALSGKDGSLIWRFRTDNQVISAIEIADLDEDGVPEAVFTSKDQKVYAVRMASGRAIWQFQTDAPFISSFPCAVAADGDEVLDIVVGSDDCRVYALSGRPRRPLGLIWSFSKWRQVTGD